MKLIPTKCIVLLALPAMLLLGGCDETGGGIEPPEGEIPQYYQSYDGTLITSDTTWSGNVTVSGPHYILPGVTLTVEEGTTVTFEYIDNTSANIGVLVALAGDKERFEDGPRPSARIVAEGTAKNPVVFTSSRKQASSWGGIVLAGRAPNNIVGGEGEAEGFTDPVTYGGNKPNDDSGSLEYVRIEYTGFEIAEGSELQGLSLYSVGSETNINHVNSFVSSDDGVEIFGGTVDIKYFVTVGADDDSFDYDQGWTGRGQFWLGVQREGADNGFENDGCATLDNCDGGNGPTSPVISNVTLYGAGTSSEGNRGLRLRENLQGSYNNIVISNFTGIPLLVEEDGTAANIGSALTFSNIIAAGNNANYKGEAPDYVTFADPMFTNAADFDFSLQPASSAMNGASSIPDDSFFEQVNYIGAFGTENWATGNWVRFE